MSVEGSPWSTGCGDTVVLNETEKFEARWRFEKTGWWRWQRSFWKHWCESKIAMAGVDIGAGELGTECLPLLMLNEACTCELR